MYREMLGPDYIRKQSRHQCLTGNSKLCQSSETTKHVWGVEYKCVRSTDSGGNKLKTCTIVL